MASSPTEVSTRYFNADDGVELAWHEMGEGRPVILIHGLFSNAHTNWVKYGAAAEVASRGFRVTMPDLRGHGMSAKPHDAASYPKDVLADDGLALLRHLGLAEGEYDLGGYSLGARTTMRMLIRGARPRRAVLGGMGLQGLVDTGRRSAHFHHVLDHIDEHPRGSPEWMAVQFLKTTKGDPLAMKPLLDSFTDSTEEEIRSVVTDTLVVCGEDDEDNGSAEALAALLPNARYVAVPGNHMSVMLRTELNTAIADFLAA